LRPRNLVTIVVTEISQDSPCPTREVRIRSALGVISECVRFPITMDMVAAALQYITRVDLKGKVIVSSYPLSSEV
jgi:hypothetical protein